MPRRARLSSPVTIEVSTPSGVFQSIASAPGSKAASACSPRSRFMGVNRQISSRPCGTGWSSTSNDVTGCRCDAGALSTAAWTLPAAWSAVVKLDPFRGRHHGRSRGLSASADRPFHLELDEAVELEGVLHGELLRDRLDEAAHDH